MKILTALFIDNHHELIFFMEKWQKSGHVINKIVSDDSRVILWAKNKKVDVHPYTVVITDCTAQLKNESGKYDCLFSIINHTIFNQSLLDLAEVGINYHAAPLPQHRGVYGTSWAIFNEMPQYAITWHTIVKRIDSGDILLSSEWFDIKPEYTAEMLELECLQHAKETFPKIIEILNSESKNDKTLKSGQDTKKYRIHTFKDKLPGNGLLNCYSDTKTIVKLYRALKITEKFPNYLGTLKYFCNGRVFYPKTVIVNGPQGDSINDLATIDIPLQDSLVITLSDLRDEIGQKITRKTLTALQQLDNTYPISFDLFLEYPEYNKSKILEIYKLEKTWHSVIRKVETLNLTFHYINNFDLQLNARKRVIINTQHI